jgi:hypothetical protein
MGGLERNRGQKAAHRKQWTKSGHACVPKRLPSLRKAGLRVGSTPACRHGNRKSYEGSRTLQGLISCIEESNA